MKAYSVVADKDASGWFVKLENDAPTNYYDKKDKAIEAAEQLAQDNKPSKLTIFEDNNHDVKETRTYE
ncbi:MAG TPA: DUF2188 domain-containing protein [Bacillales bacterium]|nr:DUF2188 domain-containing protein [Bacillales bacterium]